VTKVMFLAVIAPPSEGFDGKIYNKRVSKKVTTSRLSYSQKFSDCYHVNYLLRQNEWHEYCFMPDMIPCHLFLCLQDTYDLDEDITQDLVLSYSTYTTARTNTKTIVRLGWDDKDLILGHRIRTVPQGEDRPIELADFTLHLRVPSGTEYEKDCNCDSTFMLNTVREIGKAIREKMPHVPAWIPIHLFMDNAGGHGTNEAKAEYEQILLDDFNVKIIWQCPNSPETNMLDLGAWMSIQHVVEEKHRTRTMNENSLARTVQESFDDFDGSRKLAAIADRWELVLDLIIEDEGDNTLVESKRGSLTKSLLGRRLPATDLHNQSRRGDSYYEIYTDDEDDDVAV
jgi:hypothetical protein